MPTPRILIADDQADVLTALRLLLKGEGIAVETASSPSAVLQALSEGDFNVVLMDLNYSRDTTSGVEGLELIDKIRVIDSTLPIVVMTAWGSVETAVEAMRRGARDFVQKPWENERLLAIVRNQIELGDALRSSRKLEAENSLLRGSGFPKMITEASTMQPVIELIRRIGPSDANVMITGEHGSGKEVVAAMLHAMSPRSTKALIAVNVGGLAEGVFESEMFGHVKGAFTGANSDRIGRFELADEGTLFLDEIANITMNQQARLLRVLETGDVERVGSSRVRKVNVRMISATNADPRKEVEEGRFREDLLFRLNAVEIAVPPLRRRPEDIPLLASHFLHRYTRRYGGRVTGFEPAAMRALLSHPWPGNVRELDHVVQRAVLMAPGELAAVSDLGLSARGAAAAPIEEMSLDDAELHLIKKALDRAAGSVSEAAKALGLSRSAMYRRMEKHGL